MVLKESYWASFNRPYFEEVREDTMYIEAAQKHGELFTYEQCPRAKIFKREQEDVGTFEGWNSDVR